MNIRWYVGTKPVCEEREEGKEVELQEDADMSNTRVEGLQSCLLLGQLEDSDKDSNIGQCNKDYVKPQDGKGNE
jgi:hypothetical protein